MLDIIIVLLVFTIGFSVKNWLKVSFDVDDKKILNNLWLYHFLFGIIYYVYIYYGPGGDALYYYEVGKIVPFNLAIEDLLLKGPGNAGMVLLNSLPAKILNFFSLSLIYTLLGYIGLVYSYSLFKGEIAFNSSLGKIKLFPLVFFLPNLHFWSAGMGKDTVCFLAIALFCHSMRNLRQNLFKIIIAITLTYIVRPHISVFLVAAFGVAFIIDGKLKLYQKIFFGGLFFILFIILFNEFMTFLKLEELNSTTIERYSSKSVLNLNTNSGVGWTFLTIHIH